MVHAAPPTEEASERFRAVETWPDAAILGAIADGQAAAIEAVRSVIPALSRAAQLLARHWQAGGRIAFAGAGSSGLIALTDAVELPGTFGMARERLMIILAGGQDALDRLDGGIEDDVGAAARAVADLGPGDAIVAASASGSTPFTLAAAHAAKARGAAVVAIVCNAAAPLLDLADVAVAIPTGAEIVAGSTRMNAGTAQKCALNMLSTLTAMRLNHVFDGLMVNLRADNAKLRDRAVRIVARAAAVDETRAKAALEATDGAVKPAILVAGSGLPPLAAARLLEDASDSVRDALDRLNASTGSTAGPR